MIKKLWRMDWGAPALGVTGSVLVLFCAAFAWPQWEDWHMALWAGGLLSFGGAAWSAWLSSRGKQRKDLRRAALHRRGRRLRELGNRLKWERAALERRRRRFAVESVHRELYQDDRAMGDEVPEAAAVAALAEADGKVLEFCRAESERIFNKIVRNAYAVEGIVQPREILADVGRLFEGVARIYQPGAKHPLLETSVEDILRFIQRSSLQILVQLEQLPLDVKRYNLREAYGLSQRALSYYGIYKSVSSYWDHARPMWFLGRLALGANPLTLGLSWTLTEIATRGGRRISQHYGRRYGLRLFHDTIRIIGTEAASVYGGDYRHRDPNWFYGLELMELQTVLPAQRKLLRALLEEVGSMPLRSEYDRIFLFRCLARGESGDPGRFEAAVTLRREEREALARRLETLVARYRDASNLGPLSRWKGEAEGRLGAVIQIEGCEESAAAPGKALAPLLVSLVSYLVGHKGMETGQALGALEGSRIAALLGPEAFQEAWDGLAAHPPMLFDHPAVRPSAAEAEAYADDLARLQVEVAPFEGSTALLEDAAGAVGCRADKAIERFHEACVERFRRRWTEDAPKSAVPPVIAVASLGLLTPPAEPVFFYKRVRVRGKGNGDVFDGLRLWLVGTTTGKVLLCGQGENGDPASARILWEAGPGQLRARTGRAFLGWHCVLRGGKWDTEALGSGDPPSIEVQRRPWATSAGEFDPLLRLAVERLDSGTAG